MARNCAPCADWLTPLLVRMLIGRGAFLGHVGSGASWLFPGWVFLPLLCVFFALACLSFCLSCCLLCLFVFLVFLFLVSCRFVSWSFRFLSPCIFCLSVLLSLGFSLSPVSLSFCLFVFLSFLSLGRFCLLVSSVLSDLLHPP